MIPCRTVLGACLNVVLVVAAAPQGVDCKGGDSCAAVAQGLVQSRIHGHAQLQEGSPTPRYCGSGGKSGPTHTNVLNYSGAGAPPEPPFTITARIRSSSRAHVQEIVMWNSRWIAIEFRLNRGLLEYGEFNARLGRWRPTKASHHGKRLQDGSWHSVAVVRLEKGEVKLYVDGQLAGKGMALEELYSDPKYYSGPFKGPFSARWHWQRSKGSDQVFDGDIGPMRIYSSELSSDSLSTDTIASACPVKTKSGNSSNSSLFDKLDADDNDKLDKEEFDSFWPPR